jgi:hypothetical protein
VANGAIDFDGIREQLRSQAGALPGTFLDLVEAKLADLAERAASSNPPA